MDTGDESRIGELGAGLCESVALQRREGVSGFVCDREMGPQPFELEIIELADRARKPHGVARICANAVRFSLTSWIRCRMAR